MSLLKCICLAAVCSLMVLVSTSDAYAFVARRTLIAPRCSSGSSNVLQMKIFDWKRRTADETLLNDMDATALTLDNLKPAPGARHRKSRKGRGISAGQGATCGFGMRGQKSRSGRSVRPGFEGGQTPLYRRLPKFVGKPTGPGHTKTVYQTVSTDVLAKVAPGSTVTFDSLLVSKLITKSKFDLCKVVGGTGDNAVASDVTVLAHAFTESARAAIEAAGGKCQVLSKTTNKVLEEVAA